MKVSINPVWLHSFLQLVKTKSFTETAQNLCMTQPGVSQHIKKLESFFGGEVIDRNARSFSITPLGEELYRYGQLRCKSESEFIDRLRNRNRKVKQIKLFVDHALYPALFARHLAIYSDENRKKLKMTSGYVESVISAMAKGDCDAGFLLSSERPEAAEAIYIGDVEFGVICKKGHFPSSVVTLDSLSQLGIVSYPDMEQESLLEDLVTSESSASAIPTHCHAETICAALQAVSLGTGFTLMPRFYFDAHHERHRLHFFPLAKHKQLYYLKKNVDLDDDIKVEDMLKPLILKSDSRDTSVPSLDVMSNLNFSEYDSIEKAASQSSCYIYAPTSTSLGVSI
ncbi:Transcriptional regulator, LysR family protein [Moritella viscosa]|uniref:LysR family transcriptional regulator n=1 Tax=Moritella viscosa TaxID=80854 RepID=UPI000922AFE0|nr:LysR family transcriptional regulator [Moritella viscosa]SGY95312.1 Transcriptional regulator, LysR family protein [Moritella viscosa]